MPALSGLATAALLALMGTAAAPPLRADLAETTITVNLLKGNKIPGPRIESPTEIMTVVSGCPMERSIAEASARLIQWLETDYGWDAEAEVLAGAGFALLKKMPVTSTGMTRIEEPYR